MAARLPGNRETRDLMMTPSTPFTPFTPFTHLLPLPAPISVSTATAPSAMALPAFLPPEAGPVIQRIRSGGSFAHRQDGSIFGNREGRLPARGHGYYREYTVPTPGLSHRGARRIVTGGDPPREWYYTGDHYDSFRRFEPPATEATP